MAKIQVSTFQGIAPRIDPRILDDSQGQIGENLKLTSLALQSWRETVLVDTPVRTGKLETIYLYDGVDPPVWLTWLVDVDVVKAPIANDMTDRLYWSGDGKMKAGDNSDNTTTGIATTGGSELYPEYSVTVGMPAPTAAPTVAIGGAGAGADPTEYTIYVYTFVSFWGEESAPSPASALILVDFDGTGEVDLSAMETTIPAEYNTLDKIRIYRSVAGTNQAAYQFVAEITPSATHTDSKLATELGEVIVSSDFDLPPDDAFGLLDFGNGILVAFTEFEVLFCEPFQPHAWPIKYRLAIVDKIVGGAIFGNTLVVCTDDRPVMVVGNHPSTMTMTVFPDHQACISKQGITSMKGRVIYPSPDGLFQVGYGGGNLLTEPLYDRETWQDRLPFQIRASHWDTRYIGFTDNAGLLVETANGIVAASDFNIDVDAIHNDAQNDVLYISQSDLSLNNKILKFNAGGHRLPYIWRSKKFSLGSQATLTCCKILAQYGELYSTGQVAALAAEAAAVISNNQTLLAGPIHGELGGAAINVFDVNGSDLETPPTVPVVQNVVLKLFADGLLIGSATADSDEPIRLPAGERYRQYEIQIETVTDVNQITLASSISDLL